jgi:hypothetical protein
MYVLVALPYSGQARMGRLFSASFQQELAGLLQSRPSDFSLVHLKSSTSSALSPDVVRRTESAASSHTGRA